MNPSYMMKFPNWGSEVSELMDKFCQQFRTSTKVSQRRCGNCLRSAEKTILILREVFETSSKASFASPRKIGEGPFLSSPSH